jgi:hypothetical protein
MFSSDNQKANDSNKSGGRSRPIGLSDLFVIANAAAEISMWACAFMLGRPPPPPVPPDGKSQGLTTAHQVPTRR